MTQTYQEFQSRIAGTATSEEHSAEKILDVPEALDTAADIVEKYGWSDQSRGTGAMQDPIMPICSVGALMVAIKSEHFEATRDSEAALALHKFVNGRGGFQGTLFQWNDVPGRTESEVVETMRAAASAVRSGEIQVPNTAN